MVTTVKKVVKQTAKKAASTVKKAVATVKKTVKQVKKTVTTTVKSAAKTVSKAAAKVTQQIKTAVTDKGTASSPRAPPTKTLYAVQTGLDIAGLVPGIGEPADGTNALIYTLRGDKTNAALSATACIPFAGWGTAGIKIVNKGAKALGKAGDVYDAAKRAREAVKTKAIQTYYPPNSGFLESPTKTSLQPGTKIDRYGYPSGYYVSPLGTPAEMRALPPGTTEKPYNIYEVVKPVNVMSGQVAPWFGQTGLGTQYVLSQKISDLLDSGSLRKVGP